MNFELNPAARNLHLQLWRLPRVFACGRFRNSARSQRDGLLADRTFRLRVGRGNAEPILKMVKDDL
jgi:hypothetical protein